MNNIKKIQDALLDKKYDAMLITSEINRLYATGFAASDGAALISADGAWFFTDSRYYEAAAAAVPATEVKKTSKEKPYAMLINEICLEKSYRRLAIEETSLTVSEYREFVEKLDAKLVNGSGDLNGLRAVKSPEELRMMTEAQRLAEKAFESIIPLISVGITEKQLAAELTIAILRAGADGNSFDPIVASAPRSSMPHASATEEKLGRGFLTIDFGCRLGGWCSDTTRTFMLGEPTKEEINIYGTVLEAQKAGIAAARAGVKGTDIHEAAAAVIREAGYGEYFEHGFGHGLGLEVHEFPNANTRNDKPIPAGAVISAEPGIYLPGKYGVRIEDVIYITETGSINITELPKELKVIEI